MTVKHHIQLYTMTVCTLMIILPDMLYAASEPNLNLDQAVVDQIVARRTSTPDPLPQNLARTVSDTLDIIAELEPATSSQNTLSKTTIPHRVPRPVDTQNMLLAARMTELSVLRDEIRQRVAAYQSRFTELGLVNKSTEWDRRKQAIEQKFYVLTQSLDAIRSSHNPQARAQAAQHAKQTLEKLLAPQVIHPVDLPGGKPSLRQEKIQPPSELPVSQTLPRYMQDP